MTGGTDTSRETVKLTVKDYAAREGVSRRTVWRWVEKGAVQIDRKAPRTGVRVVDREAR
jgi:DNA-binding transcriptional regulator YiaG